MISTHMSTHKVIDGLGSLVVEKARSTAPEDRARSLACLARLGGGAIIEGDKDMGAGASASKKPTSVTEVTEKECKWPIAQVPECV